MLANSRSPCLASHGLFDRPTFAPVAELVEREGSLQESHIIEWPILNLGMLFSAKCNVRMNPPCNGLIRLSSIRLNRRCVVGKMIRGVHR
jgi:hypothetical protein